jgi:hypothetical protein
MSLFLDTKVAPLASVADVSDFITAAVECNIDLVLVTKIVAHYYAARTDEVDKNMMSHMSRLLGQSSSNACTQVVSNITRPM